MGSTLSYLIYHFVYSTKNRENLIHSFEEELYKYTTGIITGEGGSLITIGGMPDHVHIALKLLPRHSVSEIIQKVKGNASKWINENKKTVGRFVWQAGYGAFTVSHSQLGHLIEYINTQKEHHKRYSFQEEYLALLKKHSVEYDERYLWD